MPYDHLSNGDLLAELREIAMEARDRCAVYVEEAQEGGDIGNAFTLVEQVDDALHQGEAARSTSTVPSTASSTFSSA